MKLHYCGKFDGNEASLPCGTHRPGAVRFREPEPKKFTLIANLGALALAALLLVPFLWRGQAAFSAKTPIHLWIACGLFWLALIPHELMHASCFRGDVYLYTWLKRGALFVVGPEDMSKRRFVFMSLLPNLVLGVLPFLVFLIWPAVTAAGMFGLIAIASGFGDYINVFHALTQMPKGARTYLHGFHSYWYLPQSGADGCAPPEKTEKK